MLSLSRLCRPDSQPALAYGLAQDKGFIWHLKWCPAGGWEPPSCGRAVRCFQILLLILCDNIQKLKTPYTHSILSCPDWVYWQLPPPTVWSPFTAYPTLMLCTPTSSKLTVVRPHFSLQYFNFLTNSQPLPDQIQIPRNEVQQRAVLPL